MAAPAPRVGATPTYRLEASARSEGVAGLLVALLFLTYRLTTFRKGGLLSTVTSQRDMNQEGADRAFETVSLRSLFNKGLPAIIETTIIPLLIFYAALWAVGTWGALLAALAWSYFVIVRRLVKKESVPGLAVLGALAITFRTALAMVTGNVLLYFLQPSLGTAFFGLAFLASMRSDEPLIQRLARDFLPVPPEFFASPSVRRFFMRISPLWALMLFVNAAVTVWMLFALPVSIFVISRTVVSGFLVAATIAYSVFGLRRLLAGEASRTKALQRRSGGNRRLVNVSPVREWGLSPQFAVR